MEVIRAEVMGFCMGVRRAVETAEKIASEYRESSLPIFTLGPLIHNPAVMDSLKKKGVDVVDGENLLAVKDGCPVVIRAHGAAPNVVDSLKKRGAVVVDATCPRVRQSQKRVMDWSRLGYSVVVAGDKNHGEVTGLSGYFDPGFGGDFTVVQTVDEAKKLVLPEKTMLIAQTTFSLEKYAEIRNVLSEKNPSMKIFDSICPATMERQKALSALEGKSDGILVVGGRNSANTRRLLESAEKICPRTALIEGPEEIPEDFFLMERVALTAGASTPDWVIDRVEKRLKSRG